MGTNFRVFSKISQFRGINFRGLLSPKLNYNMRNLVKQNFIQSN